jgi:peptide/nickel transport system permease protein
MNAPLESTLSYLGLGIQPPETSLGVMVSDGRDYMLQNWWLAIVPSLMIVVLLMQISLIGDWLRDKLDPQIKSKTYFPNKR